jgi:hypothetical protein
MRWIVRSVVIGLALSWCVTTSAATLSDNFSRFLNGRLEPLADSFALAVGRSLPVIAASPAVHYEFDPATGSFTRRETTGGQIFVEHADALGEGHLVLSTYYLHLQFDRLDGQSLRDLSDPYPRLASGIPIFQIRKAGIDVSADEAFFNATYGLRSWLDINVAVPFVRTDLERVDLIGVPTREGPLKGTVGAEFGDTASGVGDLEFRAKATVGSLGPLSTAAAVALGVPTGKKEDFQGTGDVEVTPSLILSTPSWTAASALSLQGHASLAMLLDADDVGRRSEGRWGMGLDIGFDRWQFAVGVLGREPTGPTFSSDEIDRLALPACIGTPAECVPTALPGRRQTRVLFGLASTRPNYVDGSIGLRVLLWKDHLTGVLGMIAPILDEGLTTDPVPVIGLEGSL